MSQDLGLDDNPTLILNSYLEESRGSFNFIDKKVGFITGKTGKKPVSKSEYFNETIKSWIDDNKKPQIFMVKLSDKEKAQSGGYDILVLSWVKIFSDKSQDLAIKHLESKK